jgi:hypothetical protein
METKIIEDKETGICYAIEWDGKRAAEVEILGKGTREEMEKLLDNWVAA